MDKPVKLTIETPCFEAARFAAAESQHPEPSLFGVTDGKAVGAYLEHKFRTFLRERGYQFEVGNSANGIDFPDLLVDMKVTSIRQPQSSCPFKSARQKIYGLGYSLIVFVYEKTDDESTRTAKLNIADTIFVEAEHTADFQMSKGIRDILENEGNRDDLDAFLSEHYYPADEDELEALVQDLLYRKPKQGYLNMIRKVSCWPVHNVRVGA